MKDNNRGRPFGLPHEIKRNFGLVFDSRDTGVRGTNEAGEEAMMRRRRALAHKLVRWVGPALIIGALTIGGAKEIVDSGLAGKVVDGAKTTLKNFNRPSPDSLDVVDDRNVEAGELPGTGGGSEVTIPPSISVETGRVAGVSDMVRGSERVMGEVELRVVAQNGVIGKVPDGMTKEKLWQMVSGDVGSEMPSSWMEKEMVVGQRWEFPVTERPVPRTIVVTESGWYNEEWVEKQREITAGRLKRLIDTNVEVHIDSVGGRWIDGFPYPLVVGKVTADGQLAWYAGFFDQGGSELDAKNLPIPNGLDTVFKIDSSMLEGGGVAIWPAGVRLALENGNLKMYLIRGGTPKEMQYESGDGVTSIETGLNTHDGMVKLDDLYTDRDSWKVDEGNPVMEVGNNADVLLWASEMRISAKLEDNGVTVRLLTVGGDVGRDDPTHYGYNMAVRVPEWLIAKYLNMSYVMQEGETIGSWAVRNFGGDIQLPASVNRVMNAEEMENYIGSKGYWNRDPHLGVGDGLIYIWPPIVPNCKWGLG